LSKIVLLIFICVLTGCTTTAHINSTWNQYVISIDENRLEFKSPKGHFRDIYKPVVRLASEQDITMFKAAWDLGAEGGFDFSLHLHQVELGNNFESFIEGIEADFSKSYKEHFPTEQYLKDIKIMKIGNQEWICFNVPRVGRTGDCARKINDKNYVLLSLQWIRNQTSSSKTAEMLKSEIINSFKINF